jgi:hypothetical protein
MQTLGNNTSPVAGGLNNRTEKRDELSGFLEFISRPGTSIPLNSNFLIQFEMPDRVVLGTAIENGYPLWEPTENDWNTLDKKRADLIRIHYNNFIANTVNVFSNGISLPKESLGVERGTLSNYGGALAGIVSTQRVQQGQLKTTMLETENSFIDFIMRPWVMLTSHLGLFARTESANIKTTITATFYSKFPDNGEIKARKIYKFYDCAPVNIDGEFAKHDYGKNNLTVASVDWAYNYYTVSIP